MPSYYSDPLAPEPANPYHFTGPKVFLHSTSTGLINTATISVDGAKYEYTFLTAGEVDTVHFLFRTVTGLRALNYAKRHSEKVRKL